MSNIDPIPFVHHLLAPPLKMPFGIKKGSNIVGADRHQDLRSPRSGYIRPHEGIDLFPADPTDDGSVYAVSWGTIELIDGNTPNLAVVIRHHPHSSGVYTEYLHLHSKESHIIRGYEVEAGELIGHIDPYGSYDHLHFVWAIKTDPSDAYHLTQSGREVRNRIPMDPTPLLYRFEALRWPRDPTTDTAHVPRYQHDNNYPYSKINRIRVISWPDGTHRAATWLLQVEMPNRTPPTSNVDGEFFFIPINDALPHEELMIDVIRDAFSNGKRIKLGWRDSYFYGTPPDEQSRKMIEDVRLRP